MGVELEEDVGSNVGMGVGVGINVAVGSSVASGEQAASTNTLKADRNHKHKAARIGRIIQGSPAPPNENGLAGRLLIDM